METSQYVSNSQINKVSVIHDNANYDTWFENVLELESLTGINTGLSRSDSLPVLREKYSYLNAELKKQLEL